MNSKDDFLLGNLILNYIKWTNAPLNSTHLLNRAKGESPAGLIYYDSYDMSHIVKNYGFTRTSVGEVRRQSLSKIKSLEMRAAASNASDTLLKRDRFGLCCFNCLQK